MQKTVRVKSTVQITDEQWLETYSLIKEYKEIVEFLEDDEAQRFNNYLEEFRNSCMKAMDTNNYVTVAEIEGAEDTIVLVELDYIYTGSEFVVTSFFEENDEYYVTIERE